MLNIGDVGCPGNRMFKPWYVWDVGSSGYGMS